MNAAISIAEHPYSLKRRLLREAINDSLPVFAAYIPISAIFGLVWEQMGLPPIWGVVYSSIVYAGAAQFIALPFIADGGSLLFMSLAVFPILMRNFFYTLAVFDRLPRQWACRAYTAFALVDVPFAILLNKPATHGQHPWYVIPLFALIHFSWVLGTALGVWVGSYLPGEFEALGFALPALVAALALDQKRRFGSWRPVLTACLSAALLRPLAGPNWFLPAAGACLLAVFLLPAKEPKS